MHQESGIHVVGVVVLRRRHLVSIYSQKSGLRKGAQYVVVVVDNCVVVVVVGTLEKSQSKCQVLVSWEDIRCCIRSRHCSQNCRWDLCM